MTINQNQIYDNFLKETNVNRLQKILAKYELFKKIVNIPGDICECGVFKGVGLFQWLKLLEIYSSNSNKRVIGFDMFTSFPKNIEEFEKKSADNYIKDADFKGISIKSLEKIAHKFTSKNKLELIKGDICKTSVDYIKKNRGFKISLLHLDLDTYKGTKASLNNFYKHMSKGSLIILDEYGGRGWGETEAVDEFLKDRNLSITTIDNAYSPTAYIQIN